MKLLKEDRCRDSSVVENDERSWTEQACYGLTFSRSGSRLVSVADRPFLVDVHPPSLASSHTGGKTATYQLKALEKLDELGEASGWFQQTIV